MEPRHIENIKYAISEFRHSHQLSIESDDAYDEWLANEIEELQKINVADLGVMGVFYRLVAKKIYPDDEEAQDRHYNKLIGLFLMRMLDRLYRHANKKNYDINVYFSIPKGKKDSIELGERSQDLKNAFDEEVKLAKRINTSLEFDALTKEKVEFGYTSGIQLESSGKIVAESIFGIAEKTASPGKFGAMIAHAPAVSESLSWVGVGLAILNFLVLPYNFYKKYQQCKKDNVPFKLNGSEIFQLVSSLIAIALAVSFIVVVLPVALGAIAFLGAGLATIVSIKKLKDTLKDRKDYAENVRKNKDKIKKLTNNIHSQTESVFLYRDQLKNELDQQPQNTMHIDLINKKMGELAEQHQDDIKNITTAKSEEDLLNGNKARFIHPWPLIGSVTGLAISVLLFAGAACLFIPGAQPVALGLLLAATIVGSVAVIAAKSHQIWSRRQAQKVLEENQQKPGYVAVQHNDEISHQLTDSIALGSTASMYHKIVDDHHNDAVGIKPEEITNRMQQHLTKIVDAQSHEGMVNFFRCGQECINNNKSIISKDIWLTAFKAVDPSVRARAINLYENALDAVNDKTLHLPPATITSLVNSDLLDEESGLGKAKQQLTDLHATVFKH